MSKLSFRARALDHTKPMPVLRAADVPELPDFAAINRAVPQMPTGMEKEEESEHHLQRAISAQQALGRTVDHVIPTPEVLTIPVEDYDALYPPTFRTPRQQIHVHLSTFEQDQPEYNMDSDDDAWLSEMKSHININEIKFEEMIDCLEKSSSQHQVLSLDEAKLLLKEEESIIIAVYDYWIDKKIRLNKSLIPVVRTEKKDGTSGNNPYIAFRRRTEKMQTRKNRKNDESSYISMLHLRRDFEKLCDIMPRLKKREAFKFDLLKMGLVLFDARFKLSDFEGKFINSTMQSLFARENATLHNRDKSRQVLRNEENVQQKRKRDYKRRMKAEATPSHHSKVHDHARDYSSDDDADLYHHANQASPEKDDADDNPDGPYAFKRKKGCNYHAPIDQPASWPWDLEDNSRVDPKYSFSLTSLSCPPNHCVGMARKRQGRGGRIMYDRIRSQVDPHLNQLSQDLDDGYARDTIQQFKLTHYKPDPQSLFQEPYSNVINALNFNRSSSNGGEDIVQQFTRDNTSKKATSFFPGYEETLRTNSADYLQHRQLNTSQLHLFTPGCNGDAVVMVPSESDLHDKLIDSIFDGGDSMNNNTTTTSVPGVKGEEGNATTLIALSSVTNNGSLTPKHTDEEEDILDFLAEYESTPPPCSNGSNVFGNDLGSTVAKVTTAPP